MFIKVTDTNGQEKICSSNHVSLEKIQSDSDTNIYWYFAHFTALHKGCGNEFIKYNILKAEYERLANILLNEERNGYLGY